MKKRAKNAGRVAEAEAFARAANIQPPHSLLRDWQQTKTIVMGFC